MKQKEDELTVLQSQRRTTAVKAHKSPGSHQTEEKTGTYELEKKETHNSILVSMQKQFETHCVFLQEKKQTHTSSPLPQSPEPLLSHNLPEAVYDP